MDSKLADFVRARYQRLLRHAYVLTREITMNRTSHLYVRVGVLTTTVVELVLATASQAAARTCADRQTGRLRPCRRLRDGYDGISTTPVQQVTDNSHRTLQWVLIAAAVLGALAILAVVADLLARCRWRQPPLETALASSDPDELPRAAGLLGHRFAQQDRTGAAEHAYRAAIDVGDEYWSPIAQVALADLLNDRGECTEAQTLLEAAIASGHPRAVPAAQISLKQLQTANSHVGASSTLRRPFETLG